MASEDKNNFAGLLAIVEKNQCDVTKEKRRIYEWLPDEKGSFWKDVPGRGKSVMKKMTVVGSDIDEQLSFGIALEPLFVLSETYVHKGLTYAFLKKFALSYERLAYRNNVYIYSA